MFISPAYAQSAGGSAGGGFEAFLPLILIFVVFYFLLIRPQQKKMKDHKALLASITRGDKIVTNGGLIGKVTKVVDDNELVVEIATDIKVHIRRALIADKLSMTQPASAGGDNDNKAADAAKPKSAASMLKGLLGGKK